MKILKASLLTAVATLSFASFAQAEQVAPSLTSFSCLATNGVVLRGTVGETGLKVTTSWGFARKDFDAHVTSDAVGAPIQISLDTKKGTEYILLLNADASKAGENQSASGVIMIPGVDGAEATALTYVRCEYTIQ